MLTILLAFGSKPASGVNMVPLPFGATPLPVPWVPLPVDRTGTLPLGAAMAATLQ